MVQAEKEKMEQIRVYHQELCRQGMPGDVDEVTWNDLEMDLVFQKICHAQCYVGEQVLYHRLHDTKVVFGQQETTSRLRKPCRQKPWVAQAHWREFEKRIDFFTQNSNAASRIVSGLSAIGKTRQDYQLPAFLLHPPLWQPLKGWLLHGLQGLLLLFLTGALLSSCALFRAGLIVSACVNLAIYVTMKQNYESTVFSLGSLKKLLHLGALLTAQPYQEALSVPEDVSHAAADLRGLSRQIVGWQGRKFGAMSGDAVSLLQDYLFGITLLDLSMFYHIMKVIDGKQEKLLRLYAFVGEVDMAFSVATLRKELPFWCRPDTRMDQEITVEGLVHPMLPKAVKNDFRLAGRALITGSNASGKSTFMKALAVNVILGQTIHTCTACAVSMPRLHVMTSMALRDDLMAGESYYVKEARRLKEMIDAAKAAKPSETARGSDRPWFFVLDEILKGTNTSERIAAASAILAYFSRSGQYVVAATHDTILADELKDLYAGYYFESRITEDGLFFPFRIRQGRHEGSNGIRMLSVLGYPPEIVTAAKKKMEDQLYENWRSGRTHRPF